LQIRFKPVATPFKNGKQISRRARSDQQAKLQDMLDKVLAVYPDATVSVVN